MTWDASGLGLPDMGRVTRERGLDPHLRPCPLARRWPGHVKSDTTSYAMFSEMDFPPTFAAIIGAKDRAIDGVDQTDALAGKSATGNRNSPLTFIVAARREQ